MDPYRGFHHRLLNKRQGLGGVLGPGLFPDSPTQSTTSPEMRDPLDGILGGVSSLLDDISTAISPSSGPSSATTSSTRSSSSTTGSTTTPASVRTTSSTSLATSISTSTTPALAPTPTPTPIPASLGADSVYTTSDGTSVIYLTSTLSSPSATAAPHSSFLQNPSAEAGVFALVGIVALVLVSVVVICTVRKRRRDRLERDLTAPVTFDPGATDQYVRQEESIEKRRVSGSSAGHSRGYGYSMQMQPAHARPQDYHAPVGYGQYPTLAYHTPAPNPVPYGARSPTVPQPAVQGGANLTRKYSDRKPVPPLIPDPSNEPSTSHVTVPPQFQQ